MINNYPNSFTPDARFLLGLSQLTFSLAGEITRTVGDMHGEIRRSTPLGLLPESLSVSRRGYDMLVKGFNVPGKFLSAAGYRMPSRSVDTLTLNIQAAINGVFGDLLIRENNPLAFTLSLHGDTPQADKPLVIFVHGVCQHERGWFKPAHFAFVETLRAQGFAVSYIRYNSGLPIAENGRLVAELLANVDASRVVLVGHSMGGLVSRSALHQSREAGHDFGQRVTHLATLGTPHHGADAERIGNYSNRLMAASRYSAPLTSLGNLRSAAIHDLRFGSLLHSDRQRAGDVLHTHDPREHIPAPSDVQHFYLAATRSVDNSARKLRSDMLVTPASALAEDYPGTEAVKRELLYGLDHMQLMWDQQVYERLASWLELS